MAVVMEVVGRGAGGGGAHALRLTVVAVKVGCQQNQDNSFLTASVQAQERPWHPPSKGFIPRVLGSPAFPQSDLFAKPVSKHSLFSLNYPVSF